jgi:hypothetical protein
MQTTTPSAKWYRHITELPLNRFIDCLVDDNIYALVITGNPDQVELKAAWLDIQSEYADAIGNSEYRLFVNLMKEVIVLGTTLDQINVLVSLLEEYYHIEIHQRLNKLLNATIALDPTDPDKYKAGLKGAIMRSKSIKIKLDLKNIQLKDIQAKMEEPGKKPEREYFHSVLITLSDHAKYQIADNITVYEYCDRVKRFVKYCEQAIKQGGKR